MLGKYHIELLFLLCSLQVDILDTSGDMQFPAMRRLSIATAHAFMLVYATTSAPSFQCVKQCFEEIREQRADFQVSARHGIWLCILNAISTVVADADMKNCSYAMYTNFNAPKQLKIKTCSKSFGLWIWYTLVAFTNLLLLFLCHLLLLLLLLGCLLCCFSFSLRCHCAWVSIIVRVLFVCGLALSPHPSAIRLEWKVL